VKNGCYLIPKKPGYSIDMKEASLLNYEWPTGTAWKDLIAQGVYTTE